MRARQTDARSESSNQAGGQDLSLWWIVGATMLAVSLRGAWAWHFGNAIDQEGAEYARIAENLLRGRGYVGIFNNGVQLVFPPLFPLMIAGVSQLTGNFEWAARLVCIVFGAALVVPLTRIADWTYGPRVAKVVAAILVLHPMLIAASASTYSEVPYFTLLSFALMCAARWLASRRSMQAVGSGVLFGLAYLIRPEAFLLVFFLAGCALLVALFSTTNRSLWRGAAALLATFLLVALPYIVFLQAHTGKVRIEAKGTLAYQWGQRINQGMSYPEAATGIGSDLSEQGTFLRPNVEVIKEANFTASEYLRFALEGAKRNVGPLIKTVSSNATMGAPWLLVLAALGLFRRPWDARRTLLDGMMFGAALIFVLTLVSVQTLWLRYYFSLFGVLVFWAGVGTCELRAWAEDTLAALATPKRLQYVVGALALCVSSGALLVTSLRFLPYESQFKESRQWERREAGTWLAQQENSSGRWVMDVGVQVAYYANANLIFLPYATSDVALRYIAKRNPDYIVLVDRSDGALPYPQQWFEKGIPDSRAKLVYDRGGDGREHIKIYRWHSSPTS